MSTRIRELRERSNLNQDALGERLGVTRQTIAAWEKGQRDPTMTQLTALAAALGVPLDLLLRQPETSPGAERPTLLYRADKRSALSDLDEALMIRKAQDYALVERVTGTLPLLPESRPMTGFDPEQVERVAEETRDWLGVEHAPLGDAIALVERRGLKVIRGRWPASVFGFSAYTEDWGGLIFVNTHQEEHQLPYERQAFTVMHELAHLIFHRREYREPTTPEGKKDPREDVANHFARAVLLPATALRADLRGYRGRWLPEPLLIDLKLRYGASVQTILYRARDLGMITDRQFGMQLGQLRKRYPDNFAEPPEPKCPASQARPRLELLVFTALVNEQLGESRAAEILGWPLQAVRKELELWLPEDDAA
ncbi:Zn-dependent peptidase ImmA (M78 family)/DNA-binding XRE family transcriptional regulator [Deinococcus metalli]|uniref:Transcriptional regulator n=1 Tax=Deinococcus metalli TaxID=1141878 RepID=A0A7W8KIT4_9DEIO|nr:XRE family transcriptional regulator [Deinococcus metalli]MBB5378986.1 Zn-dependent peptidase ImmA (M78 family)/DNA-binding XRE family transcriptional regulator [Deinococcus metalli]GHF63576.1 transcriptional regulator [Deinococcus metalli]